MIIDIFKEFETAFGSKPYVVPQVSASPDTGNPYTGITPKAAQEFTDKGSLIAEQLNGVEIFLPVKIYGPEKKYDLPYCVVKVSRKNTFIKTPLIERRGTAKELYSEDDYQITIKGFLIGQKRLFPETELDELKELCDLKTDVILDNALTNIFLTNKGASEREQRRIVIESFELPEVSGGRKHVRPFVMEVLSDAIFTLELA